MPIYNLGFNKPSFGENSYSIKDDELFIIFTASTVNYSDYYLLLEIYEFDYVYNTYLTILREKIYPVEGFNKINVSKILLNRFSETKPMDYSQMYITTKNKKYKFKISEHYNNNINNVYELTDVLINDARLSREIEDYIISNYDSVVFLNKLNIKKVTLFHPLFLSCYIPYYYDSTYITIKIKSFNQLYTLNILLLLDNYINSFYSFNISKMIHDNFNQLVILNASYLEIIINNQYSISYNVDNNMSFYIDEIIYKNEFNLYDFYYFINRERMIVNNSNESFNIKRDVMNLYNYHIKNLKTFDEKIFLKRVDDKYVFSSDFITYDELCELNNQFLRSCEFYLSKLEITNNNKKIIYDKISLDNINYTLNEKLTKTNFISITFLKNNYFV